MVRNGTLLKVFQQLFGFLFFHYFHSSRNFKAGTSIRSRGVAAILKYKVVGSVCKIIPTRTTCQNLTIRWCIRLISPKPVLIKSMALDHPPTNFIMSPDPSLRTTFTPAADICHKRREICRDADDNSWIGQSCRRQLNKVVHKETMKFLLDIKPVDCEHWAGTKV